MTENCPDLTTWKSVLVVELSNGVVVLLSSHMQQSQNAVVVLPIKNHIFVEKSVLNIDVAL